MTTSYGALYNWYAVNTNKLCPEGWHVPTDLEWDQMALFLDPEAIMWAEESSIAGGKLKETGLTHWTSSNPSTNETGFTALPGGTNGIGSTGNTVGAFFGLGQNGYWWTSTILPENELSPINRMMANSSTKLFRGTDRRQLKILFVV